LILGKADDQLLRRLRRSFGEGGFGGGWLSFSWGSFGGGRGLCRRSGGLGGGLSRWGGRAATGGQQQDDD
jgi:hypothetical protein